MKISHVSPLVSVWSSGTRRPLTLAPTQRVADLGVHGVGEVDRGRPERQGDHPPLRREDEHLVLLEVGLQALHELGRVGDVGLPVDDAVEPVDVGVGAPPL